MKKKDVFYLFLEKLGLTLFFPSLSNLTREVGKGAHWKDLNNDLFPWTVSLYGYPKSSSKKIHKKRMVVGKTNELKTCHFKR
jgi:hypothetical protein